MSLIITAWDKSWGVAVCEGRAIAIQNGVKVPAVEDHSKLSLLPDGSVLGITGGFRKGHTRTSMCGANSRNGRRGMPNSLVGGRRKQTNFSGCLSHIERGNVNIFRYEPDRAYSGSAYRPDVLLLNREQLHFQLLSRLYRALSTHFLGSNCDQSRMEAA